LRVRFAPGGHHKCESHGAAARTDVVEIMVNEDGRILIDSLVDGVIDTGERLRPHEAEDLVVTIASRRGRRSPDRRRRQTVRPGRLMETRR
jgi:Flp pilus assembly CpaF family ATPase